MNVFLLVSILVSANLKVQIKNGSPGGVVPKLKVYLLFLSQTGEEEIVDSGMTRGEIIFGGLHTSNFYRIETNYLGIPYSSAPVPIMGDTSIVLLIYDTTSTRDSIAITDIHLAIMEEEGGYRWTEVVSVLNASSYTYHVTPTLYFLLPSKEAKGTFTPVEPPTYRFWELGEDTLYSHRPVYPGQNVIAYMFFLSDFEGYRILREFDFPVHRFRVLLSSGFRLKSDDFEYTGKLERGGLSFRVYASRKTGRKFEFEVNKRKPLKPYIAPAVALIVAILALIALLSMRKRTTP